MTHFVKSRAKVLKIGINLPTSKYSLVFINNSSQDRTEITLETFFRYPSVPFHRNDHPFFTLIIINWPLISHNIIRVQFAVNSWQFT